MKNISVQKIGRLLVIGINRPEVANKLDRLTAHTLKAVFEQDFEGDPDVSAAVLHGECGNFCSGWDWHRVETSMKEKEAQFSLPDMLPDRVKKTEPFFFRKPLFAALSGKTFGCGLQLALACDIRIAEPDAILSLDDPPLSLPLLPGIARRISFLVGASAGLDLVLNNRTLNASQSQSLGLLNRVTKPGVALGTAVHIADGIIRNRFFATRNLNRHILLSSDSSLSKDDVSIRSACYENIKALLLEEDLGIVD